MPKKPTKNVSLINVIAEGKDERGGRYFLFGVEGEPIPNLSPILASRLIKDQQKVLGELMDAGFGLVTPAVRKPFLDSVQDWETKAPSFKVATKIGWNGATYVLPDQSNSQQNVYPVLDELNPNTLEKYRVSRNDSLEDWQQEIGKLCVNNSRLMFAVALAFTGPILRFIDGERSGGFQIYGDPETGKTTAAMVAGSIWGCHRLTDLGFLETWNSTNNAVELTALAHNDGLLILDETKGAGSTDAKRAQVVMDVTMRLAEQKEKRRLNQSTQFRSWRFFFLSTSNFSLEELATKADAVIDAAVRGRLVDIPLPDGPHGIYEDLHGFPSGSELTDRLKKLCRLYYGVPIREFILKLLDHLVRGKGSKVRELKDRVMNVKNGLQKVRIQYLRQLERRSGDVKALNRASNRFATVYAAGALAIRLGVLDWNRSALGEAILRCQLDGLKPRLTKQDSAILETGKKLLHYLQKQEASSINLRKQYADPNKHTFGSVPYYKAKHKGHTYWYLTADALKSIIGTGAAASAYKQYLEKRGRLDVSSGGKGGRRFVVERRIFIGKGKQGWRSVHAIRTQPLKTSA
jgi:putative DNA primase/helicase